jgi:hypothetical protein
MKEKVKEYVVDVVVDVLKDKDVEEKGVEFLNRLFLAS